MYSNTNKSKVNNEYADMFNEINDTITQLPSERLIKELTCSVSFKDIFLEYESYRFLMLHEFAPHITTNMDIIEKEFPIISKLYDRYGADRVKELNYDLVAIIKDWESWNKSIDQKIVLYLKDMGIKEFTTIRESELEKALQSTYNSLGIEKWAEASHIWDWFKGEQTCLTSMSGTKVTYYELKELLIEV